MRSRGPAQPIASSAERLTASERCERTYTSFCTAARRRSVENPPSATTMPGIFRPPSTRRTPDLGFQVSVHAAREQVHTAVCRQQRADLARALHPYLIQPALQAGSTAVGAEVVAQLQAAEGSPVISILADVRREIRIERAQPAMQGRLGEIADQQIV